MKNAWIVGVVTSTPLEMTGAPTPVRNVPVPQEMTERKSRLVPQWIVQCWMRDVSPCTGPVNAAPSVSVPRVAHIWCCVLRGMHRPGECCPIRLPLEANTFGSWYQLVSVGISSDTVCLHPHNDFSLVAQTAIP